MFFTSLPSLVLDVITLIITSKGGVLMTVKTRLFEQKPDYDIRAAMEADRINDNGTPVGREDVWHDD